MKQITLLFLLLTSVAFAQPGTLDTSFNPADVGFGSGRGTNSIVNGIAVQPDGKILIVGGFSTYNTAPMARLGRLNADGTVDPTFSTTNVFPGGLNGIKLLPDGKMLVYGGFNTWNGSPAFRIKRLNADGTVDNTFAPPVGVNSTVTNMIVQPDGKIVAIGEFTTYNGINSNRIVRMFADGSLDSSFSVGTGLNFTANDIELQADGKIIVAGDFTNYKSTAVQRIIRLTSLGALDETFSVGTGPDASVLDVALLNDNSMVVGGAFGNFNGSVRKAIVKLGANGALDNTFQSLAEATQIEAVALQPDGKILIVGPFSTINGVARNRFARLNSNGTLDNSFTTGSGTNNPASEIQLLSDGKILLGGSYAVYDGYQTYGINRILADGTKDPDFNKTTGASDEVMCSVTQPDGKIVMGGMTNSYDGTIVNRLFRTNADGSLDTSFNSGSGANNRIYSIARQPDGKLIVAGDFTTFNSLPIARIVRLNEDGSIDSSFNVGTGFNNTAMSVVIQPDGKILVGGSFATYNSTAVKTLVRLNSNGSIDTSFVTPIDSGNVIYQTLLQPDGKVLACGEISTFNQYFNRLIRLNADGSLDATFNLLNNFSDRVLAIGLRPDGRILAGGWFSTVNGSSYNSLVGLTPEGQIDSSFNVGTGMPGGEIRSIDFQSNGDIIVAGNFISYNGNSSKHLVSIKPNGAYNTNFITGTGPSAYLFMAKVQTDDSILIGGLFTSYNGIGRNRVARIIGVMPPLITITTSIPQAIYCQGQTLPVSFTATGTFDSANVFTAQLSDASGTFTAPTTIGTLNGTAGGEITATIPVGITAGTGYRIRVVANNPTVESNDNGSNIAIGEQITYYLDADGDGFGNAAVSITTCPDEPEGYVTNAFDCNDAQLTYVDADGDGFGSAMFAPCGVSNNSDCDDNQLQYVDADGDGFGSGTYAACGVLNNFDCNDNQLQYVDADGDGFGSNVFAPCGVIDNSDCDDNQLQYVDADGDGFGSGTYAACGVLNNFDCNDNQLQYVDADGDGFGSDVLAPCGLTNNSDCDDNQLQYVDADGDGFGSGTYSACSGILNNFDCNDNQLQYVDADGDGFGSNVFSPCGVIDNSDCDDNQLQYVDADGDGFGSGTYAACGVLNNFDCNDNQLQYVDADGDGFGSNVLAPCGLTNNSDCDDNQLQYVDADGDGFGSGTYSACSGILNNSDCNDASLTYVDADGDGFGSTTYAPCGVSNSSDCDDSNGAVYQGLAYYVDADGDGYGSGTLQSVCSGSTTIPTGFSDNNYDCDDTRASVRPYGSEIGYNLIDDDCDGYIDEGFPPKSTVIMNSQCNVVLPSIDTQLMANLVAGAQGYQWRITSMSGPNIGQVQTLNTPLRAMKLSQLTSFAYNTTYKVEVAVIYNGFVQPYTASDCTVTTPIVTTKLTKCGQTLTSVSNAVYADIIQFAAGYRFKITDPATPSNTQEIYRNVREFRMNLITAFSVQYNKTYNVEVSIKNTDGSYLPYGALCTVTTPAFPTTSIQDSQCQNYLPTAYSTPIYATDHTGAIAYVFNLSGNGLPVEGAEITRTTRAFKLSDFPMLAPGSSYNVKVRLIFNNNDLPGEYGPTCTVVAPGLLRAVAIPFNVSASPNPFASGFNLQIKSSSTDQVTIEIFDMTGRMLELQRVEVSKIDALILGEKFPSGVFNVVVTQGDEVKTLRIVKR